MYIYILYYYYYYYYYYQYYYYIIYIYIFHGQTVFFISHGQAQMAVSPQKGDPANPLRAAPTPNGCISCDPARSKLATAG